MLYSQLGGLGEHRKLPQWLANHAMAHFELERVKFGDKKCPVFDNSAKAEFHESRAGWWEYA